MHEASFIEKTSQTERRQPDEAGIPPVLWAGTSVLAFTWVASCLLLSMAIMGWLSFQLTGGTFTWADVWFGLVAVFLLWAGLGALPQQLKGTSGVLVTRADAPVLFDALDRLRNQLKGPRIERVLLDTQFHIGIRQDRRFGGFGGKLNCLTIGLPLMLLGSGKAEINARVAHMLTAVGLQDMGARLPQQLSGGQLQRVAIARALVHRPPLVLADEPTGNLDPTTAARVMDVLATQTRESGASLVLVTHSEAAAQRADRVLHLCADGIQHPGAVGVVA